MKQFTIILAILFLPVICFGQMKKYEYVPKAGNKVEIKNLLGDITLQNTSGKAIIIESDFQMEVPDRAKGLKLLGSVEDNTDIGINLSEENGVISIVGAVRQVRDHKYKILIPFGMAVNLDYNNPFANGELNIDSFKGSLDIHTLSANVKITNSTGPFAINSISGNIEVAFIRINQEASTSLASISGLIDVTVPTGEKATFTIHSMQGNIYNNLDLKSLKEDIPNKRANDMKVIRQSGEFTLNGGGQKVLLETITGNIYLRKK
jgi:lia operon protein LiaG